MYYLKQDNFWRDDLDDREVMVTINCVTYNHAKFLRDALEGFVSQQTTFRVEAIVHDDCSTDGTTEILKEYAEKYPSIIKPIFEEENQYSKGGGSLSQIMSMHRRGKYVAMCEGDDYWTDPLKLQKQVDFLESHPDYQMCFHGSMVHYENGFKQDHPWATLENREYKSLELFLSYLSQTASLVFRKTVYDSELYNKFPSNLIYDVSLIAIIAQLGKVWGFKECMNVYRKHTGGVSYKMASPIETIDKENNIIDLIGGELKSQFTKIKKKRQTRHCQYYIYIHRGNLKFFEKIKLFKYSLDISVYETLRSYVSTRWNIKKFFC